jgi:hypothetical protein
MRQALYLTGLVALVLSAAVAEAGSATAPVPEIGGGSISTGLGLLAGGALMLRARFGRK